MSKLYKFRRCDITAALIIDHLQVHYRCTLSSKNLYFFERWSLDRFHSNPKSTTLLMWALLLVFLFVTISFALVPSWEEFDDDAFHLLQVPIIWTTAHLFFGALSLGFQLGVFAIIMRLEHLASHIGEKRPADVTSKINKSVIRACLIMTALFDSVVIFIILSPLGVVRQPKSLARS